MQTLHKDQFEVPLMTTYIDCGTVLIWALIACLQVICMGESYCEAEKTSVLFTKYIDLAQSTSQYFGT